MEIRLNEYLSGIKQESIHFLPSLTLRGCVRLSGSVISKSESRFLNPKKSNSKLETNDEFDPRILLSYFCLDGYKGTKYYDGQVPVVPRSWAHICLGLDTVSGLLRIAVNGQVIENEEREFFRGTDSIKPKSVAGKFAGKVSVSEHFEGLCTF